MTTYLKIEYRNARGAADMALYPADTDPDMVHYVFHRLDGARFVGTIDMEDAPGT